MFVRLERGTVPVEVGKLDLSTLIDRAHMAMGCPPKLVSVHPDVFHEMVTALGCPDADSFEVKGAVVAPNYAIPLWVISMSDRGRHVQMFNYVTGDRICMNLTPQVHGVAQPPVRQDDPARHSCPTSWNYTEVIIPVNVDERLRELERVALGKAKSKKNA